MSTVRWKPRVRARRRAWSDDQLTRANRRLEGASPEAILGWSFGRFAPAICLATSFGPQSIVLMHLIARIRPETTIFYLDTELLFPDTYDLRDALRDRLGVSFVRVTSHLSVERQAELHGAELWSRAPDRCCELRKVLPLRRFLADKDAWITGLRRASGPSRSAARRVEWDARNELVKVNPLVAWSTDDVWSYLRANDLPFNPLHERGYPSIGCRPCTRPVRPGEDPRSGRWPGFAKTECGIHYDSAATGRRRAEEAGP